jgi:hypothetical protein
MDRAAIIQELAKEYGMSGKPKGVDSHYDRNTGTLFIGSKVFQTEDLENAKAFFSANRKRAESVKDAASDYYEIAEIAVDLLLKESLGSGGRVVVKE